MLDATDTEATSAFKAIRRVHSSRGEVQQVSMDIRSGTLPPIAIRTRDAKRTGRRVAEARSRIRSNLFIQYKTDLTFVGIDLYVFIQHKLFFQFNQSALIRVS
jgi:hypothetical protein